MKGHFLDLINVLITSTAFVCLPEPDQQTNGQHKSRHCIHFGYTQKQNSKIHLNSHEVTKTFKVLTVILVVWCKFLIYC